MTHKEKTLDIAMLLGAFISVIFALLLDFTANCEEMQDKAFRLHIMANSDAAADQRIKYDLRDYILSDLGFIFKACDTKAETVKAAEKSLPLITARVNSYLEETGCGYTAVCTVEKCSFKTRKYGDYVLPSGEYDALKIVLGEGEGRNWWCVLFPTMCLNAASDLPSPLPERTLYKKEKRSAQLTAESFGNNIEYRFKIYDLLKEFLDCGE